jgi:hypothetical protein
VIDRIGTARIVRSGAGGGTIRHGPSEIPGGESSLAALDPQGGIFGWGGPHQ